MTENKYQSHHMKHWYDWGVPPESIFEIRCFTR